MHWFLITLIAPFLYALTNHIDKILLEKYFKNDGVGVLVLISTLLSSLALPVFYIQDTAIFSPGINNIGAMALVGVLNFLVLLLYLLALKDEEASIVVVFYQLVPVFGVFLGYVYLHEIISYMQLLAMGIVLLGTSIISFEIDNDNKFRLKKRTVWLMISASFFWALGSVIFKSMAIVSNVPIALFWEHLTLLCIGILILIFVRKYRESFFKSLKSNSTMLVGANIGNEITYMIGNWVFAFSYLLAPVAIILLMNSFQPIFVFFIGIILTIIAPKLAAEKITLMDVSQKLVAVFLTGFGAYLLVLYS